MQACKLSGIIAKHTLPYVSSFVNTNKCIDTQLQANSKNPAVKQKID
jgi:hypothetical protein